MQEDRFAKKSLLKLGVNETKMLLDEVKREVLSAAKTEEKLTVDLLVLPRVSFWAFRMPCPVLDQRYSLPGTEVGCFVGGSTEERKAKRHCALERRE